MADVLLEPFGGQVLQMSVAATTRLTALLALGGLVGFAYASRAVARGVGPYRMTRYGAMVGLPAFALVIAAAPVGYTSVFLVGNLLVGFGAALFGHGTLTAVMNRAGSDEAGLAIGAWGAVQATALGIAMALGATLRDVVNATAGSNVASGYVTVYGLEIALLVVTLLALGPLVPLSRARRPAAATHTA